MSRWCTRPSRSQSTPSRSAPSATVIFAMPSSENTPDMMATPPATTGTRSSRSPSSASLRKSPAARSCVAQPREARGGDAALGLAVLQQDLRDGARGARRADGLASSLPSRSARRSSAPGRARRARPAAATSCRCARRERSASCSSRSPCRGSPSPWARSLLPMMNSVEPPPMSTTRRLCVGHRQRVHDAEVDEARFLAAGDHLDRKAERRPRRARRNGPAFFATRSALVPTTRTASARHAASRSREALAAPRCARSCARRSSCLSGVRPLPRRTVSLQRIERIDLVVDHAPDGEVEAVGAEVDRAESVIFHRHRKYAIRRSSRDCHEATLRSMATQDQERRPASV